MSKPGYVFVPVTLVLLAMILYQPLGAGPGALSSEKVFLAGLWNSLYYLDRAKSQWAEEKNKLEQDVPTLEDLMPYLGQSTNGIKRLRTLGVNYRIMPMSDSGLQSDIVTLTRDLRFRSGFCRFYPAGARYCMGKWTFPQPRGLFRFKVFYFNYRERLAVALFVLAMGNVVVLVVKKVWRSRRAA